MHDEMTLHNLLHIEQLHLNMMPIEKVDRTLTQSTFLGRSVFHHFFNKFTILEQLHKQIVGTAIPGMVGDDSVNVD